jgi:hypothetical protein
MKLNDSHMESMFAGSLDHTYEIECSGDRDEHSS